MVLKEETIGLREEIVPYIDGDGLVAPYLSNGSWRSCDNGVLFTSEYYIMLEKNGCLNIGDIQAYEKLITSCMVSGCDGLVSRAPGDTGFEAPDDYYGLFAACVVLRNYSLGKRILRWGLTHFGSYNTNTPTKWTLDSWLFRQPQLMAAAYCASGTIPLYIRPLMWYAAAVIATSCIGTPPGDADSRRLSWLLIQAVTPYSWICRMASKLWLRRLYRTYGPEGMRKVAQEYYSPGHPFRTFWIT